MDSTILCMKSLIAVFLLSSSIACTSLHANSSLPVFGAGRATCDNWLTGNKSTQTEMISWVAGFVTAANLDKIANRENQYKIEKLSYKYIRNKLNKSYESNKDQTVSHITFDLMLDLS